MHKYDNMQGNFQIAYFVMMNDVNVLHRVQWVNGYCSYVDENVVSDKKSIAGISEFNAKRETELTWQSFHNIWYRYVTTKHVLALHVSSWISAGIDVRWIIALLKAGNFAHFTALH